MPEWTNKLFFGDNLDVRVWPILFWITLSLDQGNI
jgi:hypothetical protein